MTRALALIAALAACRASEPPAATVAATPLPTPSATVVATAPSAGASSAPARCPPFALESDAVCHIGDRACTYPEGTCFCVGPPQCGGARRPDPPPGAPGRFACTPNDGTMLRPDGCAFGSPGAGSPCRPEGKICHYGACAWRASTYTCQHGRWSVQQHDGPPPP